MTAKNQFDMKKNYKQMEKTHLKLQNLIETAQQEKLNKTLKVLSKKT